MNKLATNHQPKINSNVVFEQKQTQNMSSHNTIIGIKNRLITQRPDIPIKETTNFERIEHNQQQSVINLRPMSQSLDNKTNFYFHPNNHIRPVVRFNQSTLENTKYTVPLQSNILNLKSAHISPIKNISVNMKNYE